MSQVIVCKKNPPPPLLPHIPPTGINTHNCAFRVPSPADDKWVRKYFDSFTQRTQASLPFSGTLSSATNGRTAQCIAKCCPEQGSFITLLITRLAMIIALIINRAKTGKIKPHRQNGYVSHGFEKHDIELNRTGEKKKVLPPKRISG